jgi:signal transduction histidine kinase
MILMESRIRIFFFLFLIICGGGVFAQSSTAGLLKKLKSAETQKNFQADTNSISLLNQLSRQYVYENADSSLYYAKKALQLSQSQNFVSGQALSYLNIGRATYVMGDYDRSADAASRAFNLSSAINYVPGMAGSDLIAGLIYLSQNKHTDAIAELNKALQLFTTLNDSLQFGKIYLNLGISYDDAGQFSTAFDYTNKALAAAEKMKDDGLLPMALNRLGDINFHLKNYQLALAYYNKVIAFKASPRWELDFAWSGIAQCENALANYPAAIAAAKKGYELSMQVNSGSDAARALQALSGSYAATGDYKDAFNTQLELKETNDSLFNSDKEKEINFLHLKRQEADNLLLANQLKDKEQELYLRKRLFVFRNIMAIAVVIFIMLIVISNRQKTKLNKVLTKQNEDILLQKEEISRQKEVVDRLNDSKNQLFSVISHDLRSPFAAILQSIEAIRSGDITSEEQTELMEEFYRQVSLVTIMVNNLLAWAGNQQDGIKVHPVKLDMAFIAEEIISVSNFLAKNKSIELDHWEEGEKIVFADVDHVKIVIQNLVGNAIKFTGKGGAIKIYYSDTGDSFAVHIKDSGVGMKPDRLESLFKTTGKEISTYGTGNEPGTGIGLTLVKQFIDANGGRLEVKSKYGEGSEFSVYLPKGR